MFELVHSDVWGPTIESIDGYKYFVSFIDDFSRVTWIYLLKFKSEVIDVFKNFHMLVMTQFSARLKILRSDNGTEYMSQKMTQYLASYGILHQSSCVSTPQQNGVAERKNRDLLEKTRALMIEMHVPKNFWSHGVLSAAYIINRLPSRVLCFKSPLEVLQNKSPDISHLKVFGCTCFVHIQAPNRDKLDPRAAKCIFLGYSSTKKGYKCYHPQSKKLFISRDVQFEEASPYYGKSNLQSAKDLFPLPYSAPAVIENSPAPPISSSEETVSPINSESANDNDHIEINSNSGDSTSPSTADNALPADIFPSTSDAQGTIIANCEDDIRNEQTTSDDQITPLPQVRKNPVRNRGPPLKLRDFVTYAARHPIQNSLTYQRLSPAHAAFLSAVSNVHEPRNFQEANA